MHFKLKYIPLVFFIAINIVVIVAMNFCAYTGYLYPARYPNMSFLNLLFPVFLIMNFAFILFWLICKWKLIWIPIGGMLLCASSVRNYCPLNFKKDIPEGAIKIMSYNVNNFTLPNEEKVELKDNPIVNYIKNSNADIVCIQEGPISGSDAFREIVKEEYPYIMQDSEHGCNLNTCLSRFPIIAMGRVPYESVSNRSYAYKVLVDKDTIMVINNHFESYKLHNEDREEYKYLIRHLEKDNNMTKYESLTNKLIPANKLRGAQADAVVAYIDSAKCKYVVACGDFNDSPLSYAHRRLERVLKDAHTESGNGPGISFHRSGMYFRIDNIMVSNNIDTYRTKVDNTIGESDHYPIYSYLFLNEK